MGSLSKYSRIHPETLFSLKRPQKQLIRRDEYLENKSHSWVPLRGSILTEGRNLRLFLCTCGPYEHEPCTLNAVFTGDEGLCRSKGLSEHSLRCSFFAVEVQGLDFQACFGVPCVADFTANGGGSVPKAGSCLDKARKGHLIAKTLRSRFFGIYLLLVILGGHVTNEYFARGPSVISFQALPLVVQGSWLSKYGA